MRVTTASQTAETCDPANTAGRTTLAERSAKHVRESPSDGVARVENESTNERRREIPTRSFQDLENAFAGIKANQH